ncbi:hypothetical protein [Alicyclobacillus fodiniaquatilis]|uniref:Uncharacterized protein n=1 Tax=Alicyclobacillus fodiniaquatilis TaxID=1661150 RepID=A0ABW4JBX8_9BACL
MLADPYPLEKTVHDFFLKQDASQHIDDIGVNRHTYLELIYGIVHYFAQHAGDDGRIVDPFVHRETQYATPAYAAAAALLYCQKKEPWLLDSAAKALEASLYDMANQSTADGHSNFYTTMLVFAFEQLKDHVPATRLRTWESKFQQIDWGSVYKPSVNNWGIVALAGEWLRSSAGLGPQVCQETIDETLEPHMELLTAYGMYVDPNGPMAYDMFSRNYFLLMLLHGYKGQLRDQLAECLRRGTLTSLFLQSPAGEMPTGGRSAQHQWNEAQQAFQFEIAAHHYAKCGDMRIAGAFKRAAHLSARSICRWVRASGELNVVKNHANPRNRAGYEPYTFHSQYNLLTAYLLALAYHHADESVPEAPCPAETGGFCVWIEPFFHKLVVNVGGHYVQLQTLGEPIYNPTGILRIQRAGVSSVLGPSDGAPKKAGQAIAYAPAWGRTGASPSMRMADLTRADDVALRVDVHAQSEEKICLDIEYRGTLNGAFLVRRRLTVTPEIIVVSDKIKGCIDYIVEEIPLFLSDGQHDTDIQVSGKRVDVSMGEDHMSVLCLDKAAVDFQCSEAVLFRNGALGKAYYRTSQKETAYVLHLHRGALVTAERLWKECTAAIQM